MEMNVGSIIARMTLEEKASLCSGVGMWHTQSIERLDIPAIMVSDGPHGLRKVEKEDSIISIKAVCFPAACATAASFDRNLMEQLGEALGDTCQHEGIAVILGPAVNIKRSPLCGRNFEYFSEDPYLTAEMAAAQIHGLQSRNVGACIKHFAANSQEHRRLCASSEVDERTLREIYLPAFETAVKREQTWTVMSSYNKLNGTYTSENAWLLDQVLRREWGYQGVVMSDWGAVSDRVAGVAAGLDLEMPSSQGINDCKIVEAVRSGELDEKHLDRVCERILKLVLRCTEHAHPETPWNLEEQHVLATRMAEDCMVLLKNEDQLLPLKRSMKVAFIGEFAAKPRFQGGGSSNINSFKTTSAIEAAAGMEVFYSPGYCEDIATPKQISDAVELARESDVAVVFAGLPDFYESEGYDREHMKLPDSHNQLIEAVSHANPNIVVVLHNGAPVEMPWINRVKAVLETYLCGQGVGEATVRILYGDACPSGHLPETFPIKLSDNPSYLFYGGGKDHVEYREGVFVGYRYYDKKEADVLFPFGHGLSYTTFAYSDLRLNASEITDRDTLTVSVTVKNTGTCFGKNVVQLYVSDLSGSVLRPVRELKGFEKVALEPGEKKTVTFELDKRAFAYWNGDIHDWYVESGKYTVEIGESSRNIVLSAVVTVLSTRKIPRRYTAESIFEDIAADPDVDEEAKWQVMRILGPENGPDPNPISERQVAAMIRYMPLRTAVMGGKVSPEQMEMLLKRLNRE